MEGETQEMSCETCEARKTDLQTGDEYCKELGALISPEAVKCPRQQVKNSFKEHIIGRFNRVE